ncbi:hypothetical protein AB205_0200990, partial [Aquarana catesbeiana]
MAYDRYVAVGIHLRYPLLMNPEACFKILWGSWVFVILSCFLVIIMSYICIIRTTMRVPSVEDRHRAFSTRASHFAVLLFYRTSICIMYHIQEVQAEMENETAITEFILLGFSDIDESRFFLFLLIFTVYIVTISANIFIIIFIKTDIRLRKPMYFFIGGLSFLEIWYPSVSVPRLF